MIMRDIESESLFTDFIEYTISFDNRFYDFRLRSSLDPKFQSKEQVLLEIDDYSLQKLGMWPLPRTTYAELLKKLTTFKVKVVAMDIIFPEASPNIDGKSPDEIFANSIREFKSTGGNVIISYTTGDENQISETFEEVPEALLFNQLTVATKGNIRSTYVNKHTFPIDTLVNTEAGLGTISSEEDSDGIFRRYAIVSNIDTLYLPSLGLAAFNDYSKKPNNITIFHDSTGQFELEGETMEFDSHGEAKIRYVGGLQNFPRVSLYDILQAKDDDPKMHKALNGKLVFIGSTALGAHDLRPSPVDAKMPGVLSHMNMVHMLIHKHFFKPYETSVNISVVILIIAMIVFLFVQRFGHAILDAAVISLVIAIIYYADKYYFLAEGYELKLFYCYFCLVTCYSWNTFLKFYETSKEKKQIKGTFARYVAPTVVDEMLKDPEHIKVGGSKMDITCLFSDVRDFTSISEGLTATELAHSLNMYMDAMTNIVFDTKGTLDKYIGDAIVAFWGAPVPIGNHAQFAVEAAIKMMEALPGVNEEFKKLGRPEFKVGIGLNSGECSVGNMGSTKIFSYTALGDNMNLGARLESLCKHYGAHILISEYTLGRIDTTNIKYRQIDKVIVKGKTTPVTIYEVLHSHHPMSKDPEALNIYLAGVKLFQGKDFKAAHDIFEQVLIGIENDKPSKRYKDICKKYLESPDSVTEKFDITTMTEK